MNKAPVQSSHLIKLTASDRNIRMGLALICFVLFILAGSYLAKSMWKQISDGTESPKWPQVSGIVVQSKVRESGGTKNRSFWPHIEYVYEIEGKKYSGDHLQFIQDGMGRSWAQQKVAKYSPGSPVQVFVKPGAADVSVLEPGGSSEWVVSILFMGSILPLILFILSGLMIWDFRKVKNAPFDGEHWLIK